MEKPTTRRVRHKTQHTLVVLLSNCFAYRLATTSLLDKLESPQLQRRPIFLAIEIVFSGLEFSRDLEHL